MPQRVLFFLRTRFEPVCHPLVYVAAVVSVVVECRRDGRVGPNVATTPATNPAPNRCPATATPGGAKPGIATAAGDESRCAVANRTQC